MLSISFWHLVVQPKSTSVLLGQSATFSCAGGDVLTIIWTIDDTDVEVLGIVPTNEEHDGVRVSNLTIPGSIENNNVSIHCVIILTSNLTSLILPPVFLTVLGKAWIGSL